MPVPTSIADLSTTAASNSPAGTESPTTLDNYQRSHASFIAQLRAVIGGATDANIPTSWPTTASVASKQPLDATLTAIAALTTSADKFIYSTGVDAFALGTITAYARTLLDDSTAAASRTTLGLGTAATANVEDVGGIGYSQSWQNLTGSRAAATTYTNSTGKPIAVSISSTVVASSDIELTVGGVAISRNVHSVSGSLGVATVFGVVPVGATYSATSTSAISNWSELR